MPSSIDATGSTDVSAALNAWVKTVPNGSTIVFKSNGTYRLNSALLISSRQNLTFDGNGATLRSYGGYSESGSVLRVFGCTGITIRDIKLVGNSPTPGVYIGGKEYAHGVQIVQGGDIEIDNSTISNVYGDAVNSDYDTDGVWVHDSTINRPGRAGIVVLSGINWLVENNYFYNPSNTSAIVDIEPYEADGVVRHFTFRNNTIAGNTFYFAANYGSAISDITISGNTALNGSLRAIIGRVGPRPQRVTITNNIAKGPAVTWNPDALSGGGMVLMHIDGLTVTGNVASFSPAHTLAAITDCTNVVYRP